MKDEWTTYLKSIGFLDPLLKRAAAILRFYREIVGIEIQTIFVSEYLDSNGTRVYEGLWVFSGEHLGEAKFFGPTERIDLVPLKNNVGHWIAKKTAFEFGGTTTDASRLMVTCRLGEGRILGRMKASGPNCARLAEVLRKHIIPALRSR